MRVRRSGSPTETMPYTIEATGERTWHGTIDAYRAADYLVADDGSILTTRELDFEENVEVVYDPPLLTLPATLAPGQVIEGSSRAVIRDLDSGRVRDQGRCNYTLELLGRRRYATPAGVFDAWIVRNRRHIDLRLADVRVVIDSAYAAGRDGHGQVGQRIEQRVRALGLFTRQREEERRLVE